MQKVYFLKPFKWYFFLFFGDNFLKTFQQMNFLAFSVANSQMKIFFKKNSRWRVILCLLRGVKAPPSFYHLMIFWCLITGWPGWSVMECYTRPQTLFKGFEIYNAFWNSNKSKTWKHPWFIKEDKFTWTPILPLLLVVNISCQNIIHY